MIPQPKSILTHEHMQKLFADAHPTGKLSLSKDVGGAKRRYSVVFSDGGKSYSYSGTAKDVAAKLDLLPQYAIVRNDRCGNVVEHWNERELAQIAAYLNSDEYAAQEVELARMWGEEYVHPNFSVKRI